MDISIGTFIGCLVICAVISSVITFLICDKRASFIHIQNIEQFKKALYLYQKEIDILKAEIENSNTNPNRK